MRRKLLLCSTIFAGLALAAPAMAQTAPSGGAAAPSPACAAPDAKGNCPPEQTVTVTGSRIRHTDFTSPSPIQVITSEESTLQGLTDTTQILQQSTIASNAVQINNFFTGFLVNGGAGVNTLNLRGLGAARTLIILDGRRMGPAGVGGTVGAVDLNTIPSSIIDHVDILKDGASSIYGSDAVAGVVNIVTRKNLDGGDIHLNVNPGERPGGEQWEADAAWGHTFNRGFISASGQLYRQEALHDNQRSYTSCTTDLRFSPTTGQRLDIIDPTTGKPKCQNSAFLGEVIDDSFTGFAYAPNANAKETALTFGLPGPGGHPNPTDFIFGGPGGNNLNGLMSVGNVFHTDGSIDSPLVGSLTGSGAPVDQANSRTSLGLFGTDDPRLGRITAVSPVRRYSFFASGGYDINVHAQAYFDVLLNRRESQQDLVGQLFPSVAAGNVFNPFNGTFLDGATALPVSLRELNGKQHVDYGRIVVGLRGDLPNIGFLKNWTYDIFGQYSRSQAIYGQDFTYEDRVNATAGSVGGTGCDPNASADGGPTLAKIEGPNAKCMPVNYFSPAGLAGLFTPAEHAYLFGYETGHTTYDFAYLEGSATGDLFTLPAGPVGAAVGFHSRYEKLSDTPGINAQEGNYWGFTTGGITKGDQDVNEVFGELNIPIIKNQPLLESLVLDLSGRYSDYNLYGSSSTYKAGLNWQLTSWLRFRASQGTSFRAPTLYEHFLSPTSGFVGQTGTDPCINLSSGNQSPTVKANCLNPAGPGGGVPVNYLGGGSSAEVFAGGGANLQPETSTAKTIGVVFTPHWFNLDFNLAVDYFNYDVENQIQQFGASNIVAQCYAATTFPGNPFCALFTRSTTNHNILTIQNDYVNVARQIERGIDTTIRFTHKLPMDWNFRFNSELTWTLGARTTLVNGQADLNNDLGQVGQPTFVGNVVFRFDHGPWTVNWFTSMIGHSSDLSFINGGVTNNYQGLGLTASGIYTASFYMTHDLSVRHKFQDWTLEVGIKDLFDKKPPQYSTGGFQALIGQTPLASQYDIVGRSFFLDVDRKF